MTTAATPQTADHGDAERSAIERRATTGRIRPATAGGWVAYLGIAVIVAYCLAPFYWMVVSSLRRTNDLFSNSPIPDPVSMENYTAAFDPGNGFGRASATACSWPAPRRSLGLVIAMLTAYALARLGVPVRTPRWRSSSPPRCSRGSR